VVSATEGDGPTQRPDHLRVVRADEATQWRALVPSLRLWRGVEALAVLGAGCGGVLSRRVFATGV
jgi:hypothetical protein